MHRPALINYWINNQTAATWHGLWTANPDLCRRIMMRPIGTMNGIATTDNPDHPNFTGSNPNSNGFDPINGPWDVDNAGTGVPDSVWVDLGMPVRSSSDGRLYKPLFAILCVDLDGRINLNAHGSLAQAAGGSPVTSSGGAASFAGGGAPSASGLGFGPAEVSPQYVLNGNQTLYQQLLTGATSGTTNYEGRYGATKVPGTGTLGPIMANKWFEYGQNPSNMTPPTYWSFITTPASATVNDAGSYGSPPDPFGVGVVGLDQAGRPIYAGLKPGTTYYGFGSGITSNPYELNLDSNTAHGLPTSTVNNPFSVSELECLLRPYDRDATTLPARLAALTSPNATRATSVLLTQPTLRGTFTTESWEVPCPNVLLPSTMSGVSTLPNKKAAHITDLLIARGCTNTAVWGQLLPPETLVGLKMNINRPFGNGRDALNVVVDSPAEGTNQSYTLSNASLTTFNFDGTGSLAAFGLSNNSLGARQLEARYLYVLMCLTCDLTYLNGPTAFNDATGATTAHYIAQWAINAVDFKSRDSSMTRFDYDPTFAVAGGPISGWTPQGVSSGGKCTVWGCKRPELLISETLAFHDRRTDDTASEQPDLRSNATNKNDPPPNDHTKGGVLHAPSPADDSNFDSQYRPQGSLFVTLFNPWTSQEPRSDDICSGPGGGVDLTKATPATAGTPSPVWRLIIVDAAQAALDPDDPTNPPPIERTVYFVGPTVTLPADGAMVQFQMDANHAGAGQTAPIFPGRYAVIGPGEVGDTNQSTTYLGFKIGENPSSVTNGTRRIVLSPSASTVTSQVQVYNDGQNDDLAPASVTIQPPTAVVINSPRRLSISEPTTGYPTCAPDSTGYQMGATQYDPAKGYVPAWDIPLDENLIVPLANRPLGNVPLAIRNNGRTDNLKVIYLQRLANPLMPYDNTPTDPNYNPYRTIDSMPIDMTAFNGINPGERAALTAEGYSPPITANLANAFYARQRGQNNGSTLALPNIWSPEPLPGTNQKLPGPNLNAPIPVAVTGFNFNGAASQPGLSEQSVWHSEHNSGTPRRSGQSVPVDHVEQPAVRQSAGVAVGADDEIARPVAELRHRFGRQSVYHAFGSLSAPVGLLPVLSAIDNCGRVAAIPPHSRISRRAVAVRGDGDVGESRSNQNTISLSAAV